MWNIIFLATGAIFIALLLIVFVSKKVISTKENRLFKAIIFINVIEYCAEIPLQLFVRTFGIEAIQVDVFSRFYLATIFTWFSFFSIYTFVICLNKRDVYKYEKQFSLIKTMNLIAWVLGLVLLSLLTFNKFYDGNKMYIYGKAVVFLKLSLGIYMLLWAIMLFKNFKNLKQKKYAPIFLVLLLLALNAILQTIDPSILIASMIGTFICYIMAFTIENPDLKMLEEYNKNKEIAEDSIEARSNILFKITQDVKEPIEKIKLYSRNILSAKTAKEKNLNAENIVLLSSNLLDDVNEVLDVSNIDKNNLKIYNSSYDVYNLYNQLIYIVKSKLKESIDFKYSISNTIPTRLFGDYLKLKQIISALLLQDHSKNGSGTVDLDIYALVKFDVCRLIITVQSSLIKLSLPEINSILSNNIEVDDKKLDEINNLDLDFNQIKKLIDVLGAKLIINSNENSTIIKIIIDQLIDYPSIDEKLESFSKNLSNKKRVLLVDDEYKELNLITKEFKRNNYYVKSLMYGPDVLNMLKEEHYDLLVIDDDMPYYNAVTLIKKIDELKIKDLNIIVMLNNEKESIKKHYIEDYSFVDYLLKDNYKEEIKRIKEKY